MAPLSAPCRSGPLFQEADGAARGGGKCDAGLKDAVGAWVHVDPWNGHRLMCDQGPFVFATRALSVLKSSPQLPMHYRDQISRACGSSLRPLSHESHKSSLRSLTRRSLCRPRHASHKSGLRSLIRRCRALSCCAALGCPELGFPLLFPPVDHCCKCSIRALCVFLESSLRGTVCIHVDTSTKQAMHIYTSTDINTDAGIKESEWTEANLTKGDPPGFVQFARSHWSLVSLRSLLAPLNPLSCESCVRVPGRHWNPEQQPWLQLFGAEHRRQRAGEPVLAVERRAHTSPLARARLVDGRELTRLGTKSLLQSIPQFTIGII